MKAQFQKAFALALLNFHGGQTSGLYAVGSCMLADSNAGVEYDPRNHKRHASDSENQGELWHAWQELRRFAADSANGIKDRQEAGSLARSLSETYRHRAGF